MFSGPPLVLASTSPGRRALLDRLNVPYEAMSPDVDEETIGGTSAEDIARRRAVAKAESVARMRPDALVIGADQLVELDGAILGKPGTDDRAIAQLRQLAGRMHRLITAVALVGHGATPGASSAASGGPVREVGLDVHRMTMRSLDDAEIGRYVAADAPAGCAGSYKVESLGIALFERIEGDDWTAIVGLPLMMVCSMLRRAGWALP